MAMIHAQRRARRKNGVRDKLRARNKGLTRHTQGNTEVVGIVFQRCKKLLHIQRPRKIAGSNKLPLHTGPVHLVYRRKVAHLHIVDNAAHRLAALLRWRLVTRSVIDRSPRIERGVHRTPVVRGLGGYI